MQLRKNHKICNKIIWSKHSYYDLNRVRIVSMKKSTVKVMTSGNYKKQIIAYALPIFIGYLFQQMYNTADALIVGNLLGADALAAVTSVGSITFLLVGFFTGFATGSSVIVARLVGSNEEKQAHRAVETTITFGIIIGIAMTALGVILSPYILKWIGTPDSIMPLAESYLRIYFMGSFSLIMYNMCVSVLQAGGDATHPLYYLIVSSIINVILDVLFISVFHMGVEGAATATIISETISMILSLVQLIKEPGIIHVSLKELMLDSTILSQIIRYGLPTGLQSCVIDFANVLIQSYINSFGAAAVAGIGAYSKIEGFAFLPVTSFSATLTTYVSQNMGAHEEERARKGIWFGLFTALAVIEVIGLLIFFNADTLISFFVQDPEVIAYGAARAHVVAPFFFLCGFSHIISAVLRGLGKPVMPMLVMMVCWCAVRVVTLMTIGKVVHDIRLTYWLYPLTWTISTLVYIYWIAHEPVFKRK